MANKIKKSITYKILLSFIILSLFLTMITTAISMRVQYRNELNRIEKEMGKVERIFLPVIKEGLWEMDLDDIRLSLNGLLNFPNIEQVTIKHEDRIVASAGERQSKEIVSKEFPLYRDSAGKKVYLGTVYITLGLKDIYAELYKRALINLASNGIQILVVSLGMFLIVNFFVIRHLRTIADYFKQAELGSLGRLRLKGRPVSEESADEVFRIVNAVNAMTEKIEKFIDELKAEIERREKGEMALCKREDEFRKLSQEFNALLDAIPDTLVLLSPDMKVVWANQAAATDAGKNLYELIGQECYRIWQNCNEPCEDCPVKKSFDTGETASATRSSAGGRLWDIRTVPIKDAEGKTISVIVAARDITEHRKLEDQLRQAQKMEAVGTLTGGIAHDFNNILTAIIGYGNILKMKLEKDSALMTYADQILASAERAANLTHRLLAFSRKQVINPKPVNLNEVVAGIEKLLLRIIGEDIELRTILGGTDLRIRADAGQLEQVLMNLAANARDAMPKGGTLTIEVKKVDSSQLTVHRREVIGEQRTENRELADFVEISVSDTGLGMDENTRQRIFEPFFTTKEVGKGTGLGMSMVYGIIKQHNGYINCYSELGKGATFKIYLPLIEEEAETAMKKEQVALATGTETILFAEDEEAVRKLIKLALEEVGYKVIEAADGYEAINKFTENRDRIDLLLLDVIMPGMNGRTVYEEAKKIKPEIKALFSSGYPADFIHKQGMLEEGYELVSKPVSPHELLKKVREILDKRQQ